jgi:hypothetical protein
MDWWYAESHDEERLMYNNLQPVTKFYSTHDVKNIVCALSRMSALGAVSLLVPGPKWFGNLGFSWEKSIFLVTMESPNTSSDGIAGDCN